MPSAKALLGVSASMGRAVVGDPEHTARRTVWLLVHDQVDQLVETGNARGFAAKPERVWHAARPRPPDRPARLCAHTRVRRGADVRHRRRSGCQPSSRLDARFLVGAHNVVASAQVSPSHNPWYKSRTRPALVRNEDHGARSSCDSAKG